jgi:hypothetical protein
VKTLFKACTSALAAALTLLILYACGSRGTPENLEDLGIAPPYPGRAGRTDVSGEKNYATLINLYAEGRPAKTPWAGYWWPYTANGIASSKTGASPAGKYDAARGFRNGAQSWEVQLHGAGVKGVQGWWGHCNGWCVAAALFDEPKEAKTVNGITFGVADQKALLSEAGMLASADFYGNRCDAGDCAPWKMNDVIPNQFFLVFTNYMGKMQLPVLLDRFTGDQVWNQPGVGYRCQYPRPQDYLGATPDAPNVYRIRQTCTIWWAEDGVAPDVQTPEFDWPQGATGIFTPRTLSMELWLDGPVEFSVEGKVTRSGNLVVTRRGTTDELIGGRWEGGDYADGHPDYLWVPFSILNASDPQQNDPKDDYANRFIDIEWLKAFMLQGRDDPRSSPLPIAPPPQPSSRPSGLPTDRPSGRPIPSPTGAPGPLPSMIPGPRPSFPPG